MSYTTPLYESGNVVYLKESAVLGFLEPHTISGISMGSNGWVYTISVRPSGPTGNMHYGERRSMVHGATLYFEECEFVSLCDALELAENYLTQQLNIIRAKRHAYCDSGSQTNSTDPQ